MSNGPKSDKKAIKLDCHGKIVRSLAFTNDCLKLITASDDLHIVVIDLYAKSRIISKFRVFH